MSLDSLREQVPWMKDMSDEEILDHTSKVTGKPIQEIADYYGMKTGADRGAGMAGLRAGTEDIKGLGYSALGWAGETGREMGIPGAEGFRDWANKKSAQKQIASQIESRPDLEDIEKIWKEDPSKIPAWALYQTTKQVPNLAAGIGAGMLVPEVAVPAALSRGAALLPRVLGGGGARAGMSAAEKLAAEEAGKTFGKQIVGGGAFNEAQSIGSLYQEAVQADRPEAAGETFLKSIPYAISETGPEAMLGGRLLHGSGIKGNIAKRMGISGAIQGASGATSESLQTALEHSMHPEGQISPEQSWSDYLNSALAGGVVEGALGMAGGIRHARAPIDTKVPADLTKRLPDNEPYSAQVERMHGMEPGGLGLRTPEEHSAFVQQQAERDLLGGLYPAAAPVAPTYGTDTVGEMERAAGVPPGTFAPVPAAAVAPAARTTRSAVAPTDATTATGTTAVDPVLAQITATKDQLVEAHNKLFPEDAKEKPAWRVRGEITKWVGNPQTVDEAVATLKTKIAAALTPQQGIKKATRINNAERMIQLHDELLGVPEPDRQPVNVWEERLQAESAAAAQAAALAAAPVGQAGRVPGAVTNIDPATLNAAAPAVTPPVVTSPTTNVGPAGTEALAKPTNPAEFPAYHAAIVPRLTEGVAAEDLQALMLTRGKEAVGDENTNVSLPNPELTAKLQQTPEGRKKLADLAQKAAEQAELPTGVEAAAGTLRGVAETLGVSHSTLQGRVNRALAKVKENAAKNDLPEEAAHELLGLQTSLDVLDIAPPSTAYEGTQRVGVAPSDERAEAVEGVTDTRGEEAPEVTSEVAAEETPEGEDARTDTTKQHGAEFENKWVDHQGQPIAHADVQDATQEWETGRAPDEPEWDRLSPTLQLQWTRGYIAAYDLYPKAKQEPERARHMGRVREAILEQTNEADTRAEGADAGADRQTEEGANVAGGTGGVERQVGRVQGRVQAEGAGRVSPAPVEGEKAAAPAKPEEAGTTTAGAAPAAATAKGTGAAGSAAAAGAAKPAKPVTKEAIHALADKKNISWDDDPAFMAWSKEITGKERIDDMTAPERQKLYTALQQRKAEPKPKRGAKTLETHKVETTRERAQRKWSEASALVPELGAWGDLSQESQDDFRKAEEKDQNVADAMKLKEADKAEPPTAQAKPAPAAKEEEPHVAAAREMLAKVDQGGTPLFVSQNLRKIAEGFGLEVTNKAKTNADDAEALVGRIREAVARVDDKIQRSEQSSIKAEGGASKTATTAEHTVSTLKKLFFSNSRFDQKVTVVQSVSDLDPKFVKKYKIGANDQGFTDDKGHVTLIADNIDKGSELGIFLHEMGVHAGMEKLIGADNLVDLSKQVAKWSDRTDGSLESTIAKRVIARLTNAAKNAEERGEKFTDANYTEEAIAYFVEEAVAHGINPTAMDARTEIGRWFRKLWAAAKSTLRKMGLDRFDKLTAQDVVNLAYGAARLELEGNWHGTAAEYRNMRTKFMGSGEGMQAFGWGHYLAQRQDIGKDYWKNDVERKTTPKETRPVYEGQAISWQEAESSPLLHARYLAGMWKAGLMSDSPPEWYRKSLKAIDNQLKFGLASEDVAQAKRDREFYEKAQSEYNDVDLNKVTLSQTPGVKPKGSLMRADTAIADHEWLDLDKPFSEQSQHVQDALNKLLPETTPKAREVIKAYSDMALYIPDRAQAARIMSIVKQWGAGGAMGKIQDLARNRLSAEDFKTYSRMRKQVIKQLFTTIRPEMTGERIYSALADKLGGQKEASQALDKAGIKGNKFYDYASRQKALEAEGPARLVAPKLVGTEVEPGARITANSTFSWNPATGIVSVKTDSGWKNFSYEVMPHADHASIVKKLTTDFSTPESKLTRNFVVFNDKNVQRVATYAGAKSSDIRFSQRAPVAEAAKTQATKHLTNVETFAQKHGLGVMITEDIADLAKRHGLPEVRDYVDAAKEREASRVEFEQPVGKVAEMYDALPERERGTGEGSVNKFIHDATIRGDTKGIERLSASGQAMVKAVFKHGSDTLALKKKLIDEDVGREYDRRIAEETTPEAKAELRAERATLLSKFSKLMTVENSDTYAPLKRFGDFVVSAKSKEYVDAETRGDKEWINKNQSNPAHVQVQFADTQGEADALEQQVKQDANFKGGKTYAAAREADIHNHRDLFRAFPVLQSKLAAAFPTEGVSPMQRIIRDLYLQALAENSARKGEMQRRKIAGASTDMTRAFVTQGRADASFLSNLKHNDNIQNAVQAMRKGAERDRRTLTPYLNEMLKRHAASYEQHNHRLTDALKRAGSMWLLATNPSFYLQQIVQPASMSLPVIAGEHGYMRSARALKQGYSDVLPLVRGTGLTEHMDWSKAPVDVRDMLHTVSRNGAIDITNAMDQGEWEIADKGRMGAAWNRVDAKLRGLNTRVEAINRSVTAIAAYRLALARNGGDKVAATDYAERMVRQTHGSYDASNTPRYMQHPIAQVLTQFRRFQIIQLSLIARLGYNAFKGSTAMERGIARRALTYTLLHSAAIGGALGMPGAIVLTNLIARLFGPSDEPPDFEKEAREMIGDQLISDLLLKGVPAMMGVDMSSKLGMGQILSIAPFADFPTDRKSAQDYITQALGPVVGLSLKAADGLDQIYRGNVAKGSEQLMPSGIANAMKAYRIATEGVTMRSGDTIMSKDDINFADSLMQGLGMPTTTITHQQRLGQVKYEFDTYYKDQTTQLVREYQQARKDGKPVADIMSDWRDLQDARMRNGYARQPVSMLIKAAQQQQKYERATAGGVEFTKANKRFVQEQANL